MKNFKLDVNGRSLTVTVNILSNCVMVNTDFDGHKRSISAKNIEEMISKTTIKPVREFLNSLL